MNKTATNEAADLPTRQRTVPASATARPQTTAVSSVFHQVKPSKVSRPRAEAFDPLSVSIRKNQPLPPPVTGAGAGSRSTALLNRMVKDDCAVLTHQQARSVVAQARKLGVKVALRRLDEEHSGVWRLA